MRYVGQGFEIRVPVPASADDWPGSMLARSTQVYRALYGRPGPDVPVEALTWRVVSTGPATRAASSRARRRRRAPRR